MMSAFKLAHWVKVQPLRFHPIPMVPVPHEIKFPSPLGPWAGVASPQELRPWWPL